MGFYGAGGFLILRLHGVLFFGNTHSLQERLLVKSYAVIIDFAQVISIDSSAYCELDGLAESLQSRQVLLVCSGLKSSKVERHPHLAAACLLDDMDQAVAHVEEMALQLQLAPLAAPPSGSLSLSEAQAVQVA